VTSSTPTLTEGSREAAPAGQQLLDQPVRVLLVDDQPARLFSYEAALDGLKIKCVRALSGEEALKQLLEQEFAAILLDVHMPRMDGFETARLIREHPRMGRIPIIFVTGAHLSDLDQLQGYEVGAIDYITIPVAPAILRSKVSVLVEMYQRQRAVQALNSALTRARAEMESRHEQVLAQRDALLQAMFEHPTEPVTVLEAVRDADRKIVNWSYRNANTLALELLGVTRNELLGRRLTDMLHQERAQFLIGQCAQVLETARPIRFESHYRGTDLLVTLFPVSEDCIVSAAADITDHKRTERALRHSEARHRALLENAPVAVAHNTLDGRFEYVNRAFCRLVGYTAEELYAVRWQDITHPDDIGSDQRLATQVVEGALASYNLEKRYIRKDGSTVWVHLFGNFVADDDGRPVQGVAVVIDITERIAAHEMIIDSEARFRELANNIDQFAWTCDEHGQSTWHNQRWHDYTGMTTEDAQGLGWTQAIHPDRRESIVHAMDECLSAGRSWEDTFQLQSKDGDYRWFLSRAVPIRSEDGNILRWFGTSTDVTDLRNLQVALKDASTRKDEFLAMLGHELRNPAAAISNATQALTRLLSSRGQEHPLLGVIERQIGHMSRLLDDLLDVARITQGRIEIRREPVTLQSCVDLALETAQPLIQERRHRLTIAQWFEPLWLSGDKVRLAQCITNLLTNAAKYTDAGGEIWLRMFADGTSVGVEVKDTGQGIAPELWPHIFDLFVQGDRPLDRSQGGLGIGLPLCRKLAEMHGGSIAAVSEGSGKGSTFTIRLPIAAPPITLAETVIIPERPTARVLIVDDNRDAAQSLEIIMRLEGHVTLVAYSGKEALEHAAAFDPQFVLLDIGLPEMDGYEVARRMQSVVPRAHLIAVTGYGLVEDRLKSTECGFKAHLVKPVSARVIEETFCRIEETQSVSSIQPH